MFLKVNNFPQDKKVGSRFTLFVATYYNAMPLIDNNEACCIGNGPINLIQLSLI